MSQGAKGPGSELAKGQKDQRAKGPGCELAMVLLANLLLGANWPGSEKAESSVCVCLLVMLVTL